MIRMDSHVCHWKDFGFYDKRRGSHWRVLNEGEAGSHSCLKPLLGYHFDSRLHGNQKVVTIS